jgi:hypothetical protein
MALIKAHTLNNGIQAPNAYHIISKVTTFKRTVDLPDPSNARPANAPDWVWKAGYYGSISIAIYFDKASRLAGYDPIAARASTASNAPTDYRGIIESDPTLNFTINLSSTLNEIEQAYEYIKTLAYYSDAIED